MLTWEQNTTKHTQLKSVDIKIKVLQFLTEQNIIWLATDLRPSSAHRRLWRRSHALCDFFSFCFVLFYLIFFPIHARIHSSIPSRLIYVDSIRQKNLTWSLMCSNRHSVNWARIVIRIELFVVIFSQFDFLTHEGVEWRRKIDTNNIYKLYSAH